MKRKIYYAKSRLKNGRQPTVAEHIRAVSEQAARFGRQFGREEEGRTAGLFHDAGKYSDAFQRVLDRDLWNVDHAFASAALLYNHTRYIRKDKRVATKPAYVPILEAINAHHSALKPMGDMENRWKDSLHDEPDVEGNQGKTSAMTGEEYRETWQELYANDPDFTLPKVQKFQCTTQDLAEANLEMMLYTRFLFSCLVDADYSVSAEEENEGYLSATEQSDFHPEAWLEALYRYREELTTSSDSEASLNALRNQLFDQCGTMGEQPPGLFTLTAPTGTGKTLAMLHFALRHCIANGQRRIILVLPYLTLTEQNADTYRKIVPDLLEDHSQKELDEAYREYAQRWSVPLIVTTSVRFFETLFASRPTDCRKLHSIANSVVVFDEAQSLPIGITDATVRSVKEMCRSYRTTMVFSTATQPNYSAIHGLDWQPTEIVPNHPKLFRKLQRTAVQWRIDTPTPLDAIAREMAEQSSVCTIVNVRKHARALYQALTGYCDVAECFYLTTDLCPAHRRAVVQEINQRLTDGLPCRLVATQCIEAGVDFDFRALYRALAPLESIVQAAGRCNRNGKSGDKGPVTVFVPEQIEKEDIYPETWYELAADVVKNQNNVSPIDIHNPEHISRYYQKLFRMEQEKRNKKLQKAIENKDYEETDRQYHLIEKQGVRVIVPYAGQMELYESIRRQVIEQQSISPALMKLAAPITISTYDKRLSHHAEELLLPKKRNRQMDEERQSGWYLLHDRNCYDSDKLGLKLEDKNEPFY